MFEGPVYFLTSEEPKVSLTFSSCCHFLVINYYIFSMIGDD